MDTPSFEFLSKNARRRVRLLLARSYLNDFRLAEALAVYFEILRESPGDADTLVILGSLYQLAGSADTAKRLFEEALAADPAHQAAQVKLHQVDEAIENGSEAPVPLEPEAAARLVDLLHRLVDQGGADAVRAAADVVENTPRAGQGGAPLAMFQDEVQQLMPALVALNIREARAAGHSELADTLQSLQVSLARQAGDR